MAQTLTAGGIGWAIPERRSGGNVDRDVWNGARGRGALEADDLTVRGFTPAQLARLQRLRAAVLTEHHVSIPAPHQDGFDITVFVDRAGVVADFGGLVQDLPSTAQAVSLIEAAFTDGVVLRVGYAGVQAIDWVLCHRAPSGLETMLIGASAPTLFSSLRKKSVAYKRNSAGGDMLPG